MDAVVVAAQLVTALQAIVSRNLSPMESGVITVGKIEGGCAPNVIASRVRLRVHNLITESLFLASMEKKK